MTALVESATEAQMPRGLNHVVLNVRDLDESHRFWTELLGFRHVGTLRRAGPDGKPLARMRFYSGERDGTLRHHDIALVERMQPGDVSERPQALNHVAIEYATQEAWQKQIAFLTARGLTLYGRVDRGVTQSIHLTDPDGTAVELVHELPRGLWEGDIDAALNRAVERPIGE
ncbi:MAG: VOC family protein [Acetobacteraceae bacterium]